MLLFLDISGGEILLILLAGMVLFGKDKLPGIIRGIAKGTDYIKKASEEVKQQINSETGIGEVIDDIRQGVRNTADDIKQKVQDIADDTGQTVSQAADEVKAAADIRPKTPPSPESEPEQTPQDKKQHDDHVANA